MEHAHSLREHWLAELREKIRQDEEDIDELLMLKLTSTAIGSNLDHKPGTLAKVNRSAAQRLNHKRCER